MAYWYLRRRDELLLDLDNMERKSRTGESWGEVFFRRRLRAAIWASKLNVERVCLDLSNNTGKYHAAVKLEGPIHDITALVWQIHLGSDLYRGRADLMRLARGIYPASLLIRSTEFRGFWREPDAICTCTKKHDTQEQFNLGDGACSIWKEYRGISPWELFGPSSKEPEEEIRLPLGDVPLELIGRKKFGPLELNPIKRRKK